MTHSYRAHTSFIEDSAKICAMLQYTNTLLLNSIQHCTKSFTAAPACWQPSELNRAESAVSERSSERLLISSWASFRRSRQLPLPRGLTLKDWKHSLHVKLTVSLVFYVHPINDLQNTTKCTGRGGGTEGGCVCFFVLHMRVNLRARVFESTEVCSTLCTRLRTLRCGSSGPRWWKCVCAFSRVPVYLYTIRKWTFIFLAYCIFQGFL